MRRVEFFFWVFIFEGVKGCYKCNGVEGVGGSGRGKGMHPLQIWNRFC